MRHFSRTIAKTCLAFATLSVSLLSAPDTRADPRTHDGFYLQLDAGLGYLTSSAEYQGYEITYKGVTLPSALLLGGSPTKGLAVGGGFMIDYVPSPSASMEGVGSQSREDVNQYLIGIGAFVDIYPDPHNGMHFQLFAGWGGLETSYKGDVGGSDPTGLVASVGGGYDWWVGDEWSIGVMGRLSYAPLSLNDVSYTTIEPAILATFTYH